MNNVIQWILFFFYFLAFVAIVLGYGWTIVLYISGNRYLKQLSITPAGNESDYLWVFLIPALNEGVTIADSVARIRAVEATNKIAMVINDGSTDNTGEVLESIAGSDLEVLTRVPPNAKIGKAAALNAAFSYVKNVLLQKPEYQHWHPNKVIFAIVDADGRLAFDAPSKVARHFDNPRIGGVQVAVSIYNQTSFLTRMQGLEFQVFGGLFQVGRSLWNSAFMGGNGQFNRMLALESVASEEGPWSHYLTEDQELGLRLLERGWLSQHEPYTDVNQQGVNQLKKLYRQRTRWMQGNLEVIRDIQRLYSYHLVGMRRMDALFTLIQPVLQVIVGFSVILSMVLWIGFGVPYLPLNNFWLALFFLQLSIGPTFLGISVIARGQGMKGLWLILKTAPRYIAYTWIMWPVVFKGVYSQLKGNTTWAKTDRETITTKKEDSPKDIATNIDNIKI